MLAEDHKCVSENAHNMNSRENLIILLSSRFLLDNPAAVIDSHGIIFAPGSTYSSAKADVTRKRIWPEGSFLHVPVSANPVASSA